MQITLGAEISEALSSSILFGPLWLSLQFTCLICFVVIINSCMYTYILYSLQDLPTDQNEPSGFHLDSSESDEDLPREMKKKTDVVRPSLPLELKDETQLLTSSSPTWSANQKVDNDNDLDEPLSQSMLNGQKMQCSSDPCSKRSRNASASSDGIKEKMKIPSIVIVDLDLKSAPMTTPKLNVQVGHKKRQLANACKSRPPSRRPDQTDNKVS